MANEAAEGMVQGDNVARSKVGNRLWWDYAMFFILHSLKLSVETVQKQQQELLYREEL